MIRVMIVGPKWALDRHRLHEAVDRLKEDAHISFAELAMVLGWRHYENS